MWDLVPYPGFDPRPPALGAWSLSNISSNLRGTGDKVYDY